MQQRKLKLCTRKIRQRRQVIVPRDPNIRRVDVEARAENIRQRCVCIELRASCRNESARKCRVESQREAMEPPGGSLNLLVVQGFGFLDD